MMELPSRLVSFLDSIANEYQVAKTRVAVVGSLILGVYYMVGPLTTWLVEKVGIRLTQIIASCCVCFGIIGSVLIDNCVALILLYGILGGMGFGSVNLLTSISCSYYFDTKRAFAVGIATSGGGCGMIVFPHLVTELITRLEWKTTLTVLAISHLVCSLMALLIKPLEVEINDPEVPTSRMPTTDSRKASVEIDPMDIPDILVANKNVAQHTFEFTGEDRRLSVTSQEFSGERTFKLQSLKELAKNKVFLLILLSRIFGSLTARAIFVFVPDCLITHGFTRADGSTIILVAGIGNMTTSRLICGMICTKFKSCSATFLNMVATFGVGLSFIGLSLSGYNYSAYVFFSALYGVSVSPYNGLLAVMLAENFGLESLTRTIGINAFVMGAASCVGTPMVGLAHDHFGGYFYPFLICGIFPILSSFSMIFVYKQT